MNKKLAANFIKAGHVLNALALFSSAVVFSMILAGNVTPTLSIWVGVIISPLNFFCMNMFLKSVKKEVNKKNS